MKLGNLSPEEYAALEERELAGAVEVESFGVIAMIGGGITEGPRVLLRCPGFDHAGIPREDGADALFTWNLLYGDARARAVLVVAWPGVERRLLFDLNTTMRRFFEAARLTGGRIAVTERPSGEIPDEASLLGLDIPLGGEEYALAEAIARVIEATPDLQREKG